MRPAFEVDHVVLDEVGQRLGQLGRVRHAGRGVSVARQQHRGRRHAGQVLRNGMEKGIPESCDENVLYYCRYCTYVCKKRIKETYGTEVSRSLSVS